jgi:asparagine synthase (glutamine-hydrolysing)
MCGIVGFLNSNLSNENIVEKITKLLKITKHRGPDDSAFYIDNTNKFCIGINRLSIIDEIGGKQPISSQNERYHFVFNGEIFNYKILANKFSQQINFQNINSDSKVLFDLLCNFEFEFVLKNLNGMFAFAFYDKQLKKLKIAIDHVGIKPIYYLHEDSKFIFSSELKNISTYFLSSNKICEKSISNFFSLQYVPGKNTIFEKVKKLEPGTYLEFDLFRNIFILKRWFSLNFIKEKQNNINEKIKNIFNKFEKSVSLWSTSDVPISLSLSGGIDSSLISIFFSNKFKKLETYSLGVKDFKKKINFKFWVNTNELKNSEKLAKKIGSNHNEIFISKKNLLDDITKMVWSLDEPYSGGFPSWFLYKEASKKFKVILTGTGGDELFGNYGKWKHLLENKIKNTTSEEFNKYFFFNRDYCKFFDKKNILLNNTNSTADYLFEKFKYFENQGLDVVDSVCALDFSTQLPYEFLHMTDRFSMAHSIEARTPFLDIDFIKEVLTLPSNIRTKINDPKYLLKSIFKNYLPDYILKFPKMGFTVHLQDWLKVECKHYLSHLMSEKFLKRQGIFHKNLNEKILKPFLNGNSIFYDVILSMFMFQLWYLTFIEKKGLINKEEIFDF